MPAIIRTISRTVLSVIGAELAKHAFLLCAACAFVFVLSRTYGLDLSAGFF
jgi:hypothetical protein